MRDLLLRRARRAMVSAVLAIGVLAGTASASSLPAHASAVTYGTCAVTMTITAEAPVTKTPAFIWLDYSGSGTCVGLPTTETVGFSGIGGANVSCTLLETFGSSFSFWFSGTSGQSTAASTGVGTLSSVSFYWPGINSLSYDGAGTFAWSNAAQQEACATSHTSTITMTGDIVFQDPTL